MNGGQNAVRWFGVPDHARIPAVSPAGRHGFLLSLGALAAVNLRRHR
ncbi:MAG: hypothetical protein IPO58_11080 [Betaproteobacteria bacterium]|nr:hypothetical protein [Betaproteobacteria bacterium]